MTVPSCARRCIEADFVRYMMHFSLISAFQNAVTSGVPFVAALEKISFHGLSGLNFAAAC